MRSSITPATEFSPSALLNALSIPALSGQTCYASGRVYPIFNGNAYNKITRLVFESLVLNVQDDGSTGRAYLQLADFPLGEHQIVGVKSDIDIGVTASWAPTTPVASLGSAAAGSGATLTGTEADIVASTSLTISSDVAPFDLDNVAQIVALTDSTGRTPDNTLANHADLSTYGTDAATIESNVSDLGGKINELIAATRGIVPWLGSDSSALDLHFNFACNSDPSSGKTLTLNGWLDLFHNFRGKN